MLPVNEDRNFVHFAYDRIGVPERTVVTQ